MKKIFRIISILMIFLVCNVKAEIETHYKYIYENFESNVNNVDTTLANIFVESYHELDVQWGTFEYKLKLASKDIDEDNIIKKEYEFIPRFQDSNAIFISNYSNVAIEVKIDWNPIEFNNNNSMIISTNRHYNGHVECTKVTEEDDASNLILYYDKLCLNILDGNADKKEDYYKLKAYYELSSQQSASTFKLSSNSINKKIAPAFYDKWLLDLVPINISLNSIGENMTLGTITIVLSDIE